MLGNSKLIKWAKTLETIQRLRDIFRYVAINQLIIFKCSKYESQNRDSPLQSESTNSIQNKLNLLLKLMHFFNTSYSEVA